MKTQVAPWNRKRSWGALPDVLKSRPLHRAVKSLAELLASPLWKGSTVSEVKTSRAVIAVVRHKSGAEARILVKWLLEPPEVAELATIDQKKFFVKFEDCERRLARRVFDEIADSRHLTRAA